MAKKLPDLLDSERPVARPSGGLAQYRADGGAGQAIGEAAAKLGQALIGAGDEMHARVKEMEREAKVELERQDALRAEDAFTKAREQQLDLTVGEQNGFQRLRGGAAANRPLLQEWGKRFDDKTKEIEATLTSDRQRELYRKRVGVARIQFQEDILRHMVAQGDVYEDEVFKGTTTTELRNATAKWDSPNDVALSITRIEDAVKRRGESRQWAPELREAVRLEQLGKVHSAVVQQALATGNYLYAQQWYEQHKADIDVNTAKAVEKAVEDGTQKQLFAGYQREYLAGLDNPKVLGELAQRVLADKALDDTRKNVLLGRIESRSDTLRTQARIDEERLLRRVQSAIGEVNGNTFAGFESTPEQLAPIINAAKGTELEGEAARMVQLANATRAFRNSLPGQQEVMLTQAEATIRKDPSKFDRRVLEAWRSIHEGQKRALKDAPIPFLVRQGLVDPASPAAQPLDLTKPAELGTQLSARFELARAARNVYGADFKPITPEETALLSARLRRATVSEKRELFGALAQAANGDMEGYSAIMSQLAPDDPVTAIAGEYAGKGRTATAERILAGQAILRPPTKEDGKPEGGKLMPMPSERDMRRIFDDKVRDAYAGMSSARSHHEQAARAIYAKLSSDAGDSDTSILNTDRWERAIQLATGGIQSHNGRRIVMPYGFEQSQFKDGLARRVEDLVTTGSLDKQWTRGKLLDLPLESAGDGKYVFRSGDSELVDKEGKRVVLDFNTSPPFRTSGYGLQANAAEPTPGELEEAAKQ